MIRRDSHSSHRWYPVFMSDQPLTYRDSGVNIEEATLALKRVYPAIQATHTDRTLGGVGGFGGLFDASFTEMNRPVLVSSIDGVGTKTKLAAKVGQYRGLGHDIVHHSSNDILCQGARPLFFMDYFGCSRLDPEAFTQVVEGAAEACRDLGCALIGGETAEMPGVYVDDEIDIVGSIVGVVEFDKRLPSGRMADGDAVIGLASSGLHTNGFSLARRALFDVGGLSVSDRVPGLETTIGEELLRPHRSYVNAVWPLLQDAADVLAIAHVTGGGLLDNLPRVMASPVQAVIERRSWTPLPIFKLIQDSGGISDQEMFRTFNMGIGMVLFVAKDSAPGILQRLHQAGEMAAIIGETQRGPHDVQIV